MRDPLETRYESELDYIRRLGSEFARQRPKIADRLLLDRESGASEDPHVERLIEAFAFLTARIQLKLDDDFPEITDALLGILYPHYLAPVPSMAVVQFVLDPDQGKLTTGYTIPRQSKLYTREIQGAACQFRTAYPVTLWPIEVVAAHFQTAPFGSNIVPPPAAAEAPAMLRLELRAQGGVRFSELALDKLRFFLSGDDLTVRGLHELMLNHVVQGMIRAGSAPRDPAALLAPDCVQAVGFSRDEGLLPYGNRSFLGYRLLTEYFAFPSKFLFVDIHSLAACASPGYGDRLELILFFDRSAPGLETRVKADTFRLGCCPIVNLFSQQADPIQLTQTKTEYHVQPDVRHPGALEVYSVDSVHSVDLDTRASVEYQPFYSFRHAADARRQQAYWHARRRPSMRKDDPGSEMYLSMVDLDFEPTRPPAEVLMLQTTCSNRNLPGELRAAGGEHWEFQLEGQSPLRRISPVVGPTMPARLPFDQSRWRLISHLALNHLSIVDAEDGAEALREILRLYDFGNTKVSAQHIAGVSSVTSRRAVAPINDGASQGFCRGVEIQVTFDEEKYAGSGVFLFASVLERFFALYTSLNSATRLVARSKQRDDILKRWPFRAGERTLV